MPGSSAAALSRVTEIDQGRPDCRYIYRQGMLLSGDRCKVNFEVLRRYKEAPILEPLSLPKMPVCFPLNFPLTAFSEFYGILRASLESLENTTLFRRAFTPFYTPSLIQVPPRAPTGKPLKPQGFEGFFFSSKQFWPYWSTGGNRAPQTPDRCLSRRPLVSRQAGHGEMGAPSLFLRAIIAP